jgi:sugar/nucleoside kinase (ribokinase family)
MGKNIDAVIAGHICLDISPEINLKKPCSIEEVFSPGKLTNVGKAGLSTGGVVSNTGIAMALMGFNVALMAKTGKDFFGKAVYDIMRSYNVCENLSAVQGEDTSYSICLSLPGLDRMFLHNPGANDNFGFEDIDYETVGKAKLFHLGYPPLLRRMYSKGGVDLKKTLKEAKSCGASTSLDMSLPDPGSPSGAADWRGILSKTLPFVDIFLPSAEEIFFMLDREEFMKRKAGLKGKALLSAISAEDVSRMGDELVSMGTGLCVIKCGENGIYMRSSQQSRLDEFGRLVVSEKHFWPDRELWVPPFKPRRIVSALGAGDNAVAGFLCGMLNMESPETALLAASACGALNVEVANALDGVRNWHEIARILESELKQQKIEMGGNWEYSREKTLWIGAKDKSGRRTA